MIMMMIIIIIIIIMRDDDDKDNTKRMIFACYIRTRDFWNAVHTVT
jgi:hypothetical protein